MNDPHARFLDWLRAGAEEDPPRDLAVHASVCVACQAAIAAIDGLGAINVGAAPVPPPTRPVARRDRQGAFRGFVATAVVMLVAAGAGIGGWRLIDAARSSPNGVALATPTPNQAVLGGSGTPQPTATPEPTPVATPTPVPSIATLAPTPSPPQTAAPTNAPTPRPTTAPTPPPTTGPTAMPTPTPLPTDTPTPTPAPTAPGAPTGLTATAGPDGIQLSWTAAPDNGNPLTEYRVYRGTASGQEGYLTFSLGTAYLDTTAVPGVSYWYFVTAVNSGGEGPASNEATDSVPTPSPSASA